MDKVWTWFFALLSVSIAYGAPDVRILVGSPIRQKPAILKEFLQSLEEVPQEGYSLDYYFVDDNDIEESRGMLKAFAEQKKGRCFIKRHDNTNEINYICTEKTHYWKHEIVWKLASFKDGMIEYAKEHNYDYLFLVDSDIVLHPQAIKQLIRVNKPIVSTIYWTRWQPDQGSLPQVWISDTYNLFEQKCGEKLSQEERTKRQTVFLDMLKKPGTYEVGGLGACTLINKETLHKPISFKEIKNLTFLGEDRHFCVRAVVLEIPLFVDTHYPCYHIYRQADLAGVADFKVQCYKRSNLSYFREEEVALKN